MTDKDATITNKSTATRIREFLPAVIIILVNVVLWVVPDNVTYLVAQNRDILLGRYSVERFTTILFLIPISIGLLYLFRPNAKNRKERCFIVVTLFISCCLSLVGIDIAARLLMAKRYVRQQNYFYRPPNIVYTGTIRDVPDKAFAYPIKPPAYPDIRYTLTTDSRGFRNKDNLDKYDVIIVGDSFAEGSMVSDEHPWPVLLAQNTNLSVYNLGMSAGHPGTYLETLRRFGLALSPKLVFCMLYEGNDFRDSNFEHDTFNTRLNRYIAESPIRLRIQRFFVSHLSFQKNPPQKSTPAQQDNPDSPDDGHEPPTPSSTAEVPHALSWLPVAVPDGPDARYYTFKVKALLDHFVTKDQFLRTKGCRRTFDTLREIKSLCTAKNARLVVVYAPDKPHVLVPLLQNRVSPEQLRAFMALNQRRLPPPEKLTDILLSRLDVQESTMQEFCRQNSIEFVSLTQPLRQAIRQGRQAYFTYDQHWTPLGNVVSADTLAKYLNAAPVSPDN